MSDPGLVILPTHRLLAASAKVNVGDLPGSARKYFAVKEANRDEIGRIALDDSEGPTIIGLAVKKQGKFYTLKLESGDAMKSLLPNRSDAYCHLDVAVLHSLVLEKCLGMTPEAVAKGEHITYVKDAAEAIDRTVSKNADHEAAFILRPTRIEQVRQVAAAGEKMPHKSTYFYPKLLSGLVMRRIGNGA